jgi:hypothetical protein
MKIGRNRSTRPRLSPGRVLIQWNEHVRRLFSPTASAASLAQTDDGDAAGKIYPNIKRTRILLGQLRILQSNRSVR